MSELMKINVNGTEYSIVDSAATKELDAIENVFDFEPILSSKYLVKGKYHVHRTESGEPIDRADANWDYWKIPCKAGEVFKISFKGTIYAAGTSPCFVLDSNNFSLGKIFATKADVENIREKIVTIPQDGAYLVINYYNKSGRPASAYRHKTISTTIPSYWFNQLSMVKNFIDMCQNEGKHVFTFGFLTDTHTTETHDGGFAKLLKYLLDSCDIPVFLHGGDVVAGAGDSSKDVLLGEINHNKEIFKDIEEKGLFAFGNHDASYTRNSTYDTSLSAGEIYNRLYRNNETKSGIVNGETGRYFYKDNPAQKVRYIVLDSYALASNAMTPGQAQFGNTQLAWLAEALKVDKGYSIVLCSHLAPYRREDADAAGWTGEDVTSDGKIALDIVKAYRNKTAYSISEGGYNISVDYSNCNGEVVCWMAGHTHKDYIFDIEGLKIVCTANCSSHISINPTGFAPNKTGGTPTEYIIDFICINTASKNATVIRLGACLNYDEEFVSSRTFSYKPTPSSGGDSGDDTPTEKTFVLEDRTGYELGAHELLTQRFMSGMTWEEWKESEYTNESWYVWNGCDVTVSYESPNWAIFNANGTPVKDNEVIKEGSRNYYLADADLYEDDSGETITFTIIFPENYGTKTYQAESGMTWEQWVSSDYNVDGFNLSDRGNILFDEGGYDFTETYAVYDGSQVHKNEVINADYAYDYDTY